MRAVMEVVMTVMVVDVLVELVINALLSKDSGLNMTPINQFIILAYKSIYQSTSPFKLNI